MPSYPWTRLAPIAPGVGVLSYAAVADAVNLGGLPRVVALGADGGLYAAQQLGSYPVQWSPWEALPAPGVGFDTELPTVVAATVAQALWVVARGADGNLWATSQGPIEPGRWSVPQSIGSPPTGVGPKVAFATGALAGEPVGGVWTVGYNDGQLWSVWPEAGGGWGDWSPAGAPGGAEIYALTSFCLGCDVGGVLHCFALAPDASLWELPVPLADLPYTGGTPWVEIPLTSAGARPALARRPSPEWFRLGALLTSSDADGNLEVYVIDDRGSLWGRAQTARVAAPATPAWSDWQTLRAPARGLAAGPGGLAAARNANGTELLAAIDRRRQPWCIDNLLRRAPGGANVGLLGRWGGWSECGVDSLEDIQAASDPAGRIQLFAVSDAQLCHVWELDPNLDDFASLCERQVNTADPPARADQRWANWGIVDSDVSSGQLFAPMLYEPSDAAGISAAVLQAEAANQPIRALGSGLSFSDAPLPQSSPLSAAQIEQDEAPGGDPADLFAHAGYAVSLGNCTQALNAQLPPLLRAGVDGAGLWFTEAGVTLSVLNETLAQNGLALATMGGSDEQTIAGAVSTGTHGSDFERPPLADGVRAIYLVGAGGVHHWVEPANPITEPAALRAAFPCLGAANIHYDDDLFHSALVAMGAMGVIYAVLLDVVPQYALAQINTWTTWEAVSAAGQLSDLFTNALMDSASWSHLTALFGASVHYRGLQLLVNPIRQADGTHSCYVSTRFEVPAQARVGPVPEVKSPNKWDLLTAILSQPECDAVSGYNLFKFLSDIGIGGCLGLIEEIAGLESLVAFCERLGYYWAIRETIDTLMRNGLADSWSGGAPDPLVGYGYEIMTRALLPLSSGSGSGSGGGLQGHVDSIEPCFDFGAAVMFVGELLGSFDGGLPNVFPAGYISLRACGPTSALLGMQQFGAPSLDPSTAACTGAVEVSLLKAAASAGLIGSVELLALNEGGNLHWGQSNGQLGAAQVSASYPRLATWKASQAALGGGTFENLFMRRCGLV